MNPIDAAAATPAGASPLKNTILSSDQSTEASTVTANGTKLEKSDRPTKSESTPLNSRTSAIATPPSSSAQAKDDLLAKGIQFISKATPETLGGIGVGLAAATYVVLGKLGLILIGAFGGVVLFISYEARHPEISQTIRSERGTDVLRRLGLDKPSDQDAKESNQEEERAINSFDDFKPETKDALGGLVDAIIRDYIKWWYSPILPSDSSFPLSVRKTLNAFIMNASNTLSRKRPADVFLDLFTNSSSIVIVFLSELSAAFADAPAETSVSAPDAIYNYLANNPDSSLANLLSQPQQAAKFRMVAEDLLQHLDRSSRNCDPARIFLREILAGVVLEMSLQACSKPEWINGWIVHLLEAGEPDFSQAIDVGMQTGPDANGTTSTSSSHQNSNAFVDIDGNVGNISLTRGSRNSFEQEKYRRKDSNPTHKKKLSKADEEMEEAMEEMKRMNALLREAGGEESKDMSNGGDASDRLKEAMQRNSNDIDAQKTVSTSGNVSPRSQTSFEKPSMDGSTKRESLHSPLTPRSSKDHSSRNSSPKHAANGSVQNFTSFDQIVPPGKEEPEQAEDGPRKPLLTLHNANITVLDDAPNESAKIKSKPLWDYLVQIEPSSSHYAGWMIVRRYSDFETLHEILRRIAHISGAAAFTEQHAALPSWKLHTRASLRGELERYLRDACWYQALAESEGMKRFLEKENANGRGDAKAGLGWESVGKNMADVLTLGSKGALDGGKAVFDGVTGVFNTIGLGPKRQNTSSSMGETTTTQANRLSVTLPRADSTHSLGAPAVSPGGPRKGRDSLDSQRSSVVSTQPGKVAPMEGRPSFDSRGEPESTDSLKPRMDRWDRTSPGMTSREHSRASSLAALRSPLRSPSTLSLDGGGMKLPTPVEESHAFTEAHGNADADHKGSDMSVLRKQSPANASAPDIPTHTLGQSQAKRGSVASLGGAATKTTRQYSPFSEQETRVAVELVFAIINEMYTLSSAWNIRRTLLAAAKSFLLRPGNPSLISIQKMMQESVVEGNTNDAGIAHHLNTLRKNTMPTEAERAEWPEEMSAEEKEKLRVKARKMLIERGVPAALTGVMGQAATTDALGRIFDCLQIEEVARGLMFGIILQAARILTH